MKILNTVEDFPVYTTFLKLDINCCIKLRLSNSSGDLSQGYAYIETKFSSANTQSSIVKSNGDLHQSARNFKGSSSSEWLRA